MDMGAPKVKRTEWAIETSVQGVIGLDEKGVVVRWNPSARRILGCPAARALGRPLSELFPPLARPLATLLKKTRGARPAYAEARVRRPDGRFADVAFTALRGTDAPAVLLLLRDVTDRKAAERRLRRSVAALEGARESGGVASWLWDLADDEITWSKELYRMLGIDRSVSRASFRRLLARIPPGDRDAFQAAVNDAVRNHAPFDLRHRLIGRGGRTLEVHTRAKLIGERLVGTCHLATDTGARAYRAVLNQANLERRWSGRLLLIAESALLLFDSFDHLKALADLRGLIAPGEADHCVIHLRDEGGGYLQPPGGGPALPSLEGTGAPARVLSTGDYELHLGREAKDLGRILPNRSAFGLGDVESASAVLVLPLRTREGVVGTLTLVQSTSGRGFGSAEVAQFQALAKLAGLAVEHGLLYGEAARLNRELETRVERRTAELREALTDLDAYASAVAHDLRAPLRALRSFSELLLQECGSALDPRGKDYAGRICVACRRLDALVLNLLTYSRVSRRDVERVTIDLTELVEEVVRHMEGELRESTAEVRLDVPLGRARGHRLILTQVLTNLLSNALKFVPRGARPQIRVWTEERGETVRLWVEDNGIGIAPEDQARIFRPFERLRPESEYAGTGLGLAIVRRGVERMGGAVGVTSEPGAGSRFWLDLPAAPS